MYTIDYNNGVTNTCDGTLEEAKKLADDCAGYTQRNIYILNDDGERVAGRSWYGVQFDPEETEDTEDEVIQFGTFGYYGAWYNGNNPFTNTSWRII